MVLKILELVYKIITLLDNHTYELDSLFFEENRVSKK